MYLLNRYTIKISHVAMWSMCLYPYYYSNLHSSWLILWTCLILKMNTTAYSRISVTSVECVWTSTLFFFSVWTELMRQRSRCSQDAPSFLWILHRWIHRGNHHHHRRSRRVLFRLPLRPANVQVRLLHRRLQLPGLLPFRGRLLLGWRHRYRWTQSNICLVYGTTCWINI